MTEHLNAGGGGQTHLGRYDIHANCWKPACGATARTWFRVGLPVTCVRCPDPSPEDVAEQEETP